MPKVGRTYSRTEAPYAHALRNTADSYRRFFEPAGAADTLIASGARYKVAGIVGLGLLLVLIVCMALWLPL